RGARIDAPDRRLHEVLVPDRQLGRAAVRTAVAAARVAVVAQLAARLVDEAVAAHLPRLAVGRAAIAADEVAVVAQLLGLALTVTAAGGQAHAGEAAAHVDRLRLARRQ